MQVGAGRVDQGSGPPGLVLDELPVPQRSGRVGGGLAAGQLDEGVDGRGGDADRHDRLAVHLDHRPHAQVRVVEVGWGEAI